MLAGNVYGINRMKESIKALDEDNTRAFCKSRVLCSRSLCFSLGSYFAFQVVPFCLVGWAVSSAVA